MKCWLPVVILSALAISLACASAPSRAADPWIETPAFPGGRYVVLRTNDPAAQNPPLCFALHGRGGDALSYARVWHEALQGRYLVVAPQAPPKNRMGANVPAWQGSADRDYLLSIWDTIQREYQPPAARSVVAGYSAGAGVAKQLVAHRRAQFGGLICHGAAAISSPTELSGLAVFLLVGERDISFTPAKAMALQARLTAAGVPAQLHIVEQADHASVYAKVRAAADWVLRGFARPE